MEYWSDGVLEKEEQNQHSNTPALQYSSANEPARPIGSDPAQKTGLSRFNEGIS
jgi:hypothetical protein